MPFDIRSVGLAPPHSLTHGTSFEVLFKAISADSVERVTKDKEGLYRITWTLDKDVKLLENLWIDENKGFSPVRYEHRFDISDEKAKELPSFFKKVRLSVQATWQKRSGVWVPKTMRVEEGRSVYELAFDWEKVNEPIDQKLFTKEGLKLDPATEIVDHRLGRPVIVGRVGGIEKDQSGPPQRRWSYWIWLGLGTAGLVLVVLVGVVIRRRILSSGR